jgi:hypothetical protein
MTRKGKQNGKWCYMFCLEEFRCLSSGKMSKSVLTLWFVTVKMYGGNSVCQVALCKAASVKTVHCPLLACVHFNQSSSH